MRKVIVLALVVVIAAFSLAYFLIGGDTSNTNGISHVQPGGAADAPTLESLMKSGELALEDGDWQRADEFFGRVLDINQEHAPAYLGKLCAELKIKSEADLANHKARLDDMPNYQKALRFADASYKAKLTGYNQAITSRIAGANFRVGSIIQFGGLDWRVLEMQGNKALIITENVIEQRLYNAEGKEVTWETSSLRKYLNDEFYAKFKSEEQAQIAETKISTSNNLWYGTKGGADTTDKMFLLSIEEVDKYFGNSGDYLNKVRKEYQDGSWKPADNGYGVSNANDNNRIAMYNNAASVWWLRTPGDPSQNAAIVFRDGRVSVNGLLVLYDHIGVRPALWLIVP